MKAVVYIHGKGGTAEEAKHYEALSPDNKVFGFDYKSQTPWDAGKEFTEYFRSIQKDFECVTIIANSIGAFLHWFHTDEQMKFLDKWILSLER